MTLTINYNNGNQATFKVNYFILSDGKYIFTIDHDVRSLGRNMVEIPAKNVESIELEEF